MHIFVSVRISPLPICIFEILLGILEGKSHEIEKQLNISDVSSLHIQLKLKNYHYRLSILKFKALEASRIQLNFVRLIRKSIQSSILLEKNAERM